MCPRSRTGGAVRPLIPDLLDAGIDILNPVQISAKDMDLRELKREFGQDLVFWGGGVDTQKVLHSSTPEEVRADVKRNIEALAPGGGFVFAAVHDIQANVTPENIMAMWQAWQDYSKQRAGSKGEVGGNKKPPVSQGTGGVETRGIRHNRRLSAQESKAVATPGILARIAKIWILTVAGQRRFCTGLPPAIARGDGALQADD